MDFMEASTAKAPQDEALETDGHDLIAEQLKTAETDDERAAILAPCIGEVIQRGGRAVNILDPENNVHKSVRMILEKTGVIPN